MIVDESSKYQTLPNSKPEAWLEGGEREEESRERENMEGVEKWSGGREKVWREGGRKCGEREGESVERGGESVERGRECRER